MNIITQFVTKSKELFCSLCNIVTVLGFYTLLCSCGGSDSPDTLVPDAPRLLESSPVNGEKNLSAGNLAVVLTYDQRLTLPADARSKITIAGATVSEVSVYLTKATILITGLENGKTYELVVSQGAVLGLVGVEAPRTTISFSTAEAAGPPIAKLCTPNPLPQAQKVYDYLFSIYGEKLLSGAMANVNWNIAEAELVKQATGKYPAIAFFDYLHLFASPADWIDYGDIKVAKDWWDVGGLIGAGWHWNVPNVKNGVEYTCTPGDGNKGSDGNWTTTFCASNATVDGTWENEVVKADLEKMAGYLKLLQDKNIPLIWRPLHEAAGNIYEYTGGKAWFWWGYDGANAYKKIWIYMFNFFKEKGINNLIWVWTTQTKDADFYPGDDYVDIVGRDIYNQKDGAANAAQYSSIKATYSGKPVALSECGSVATVSSQWSAGARWSFFMPWYQYNATGLDGHEHADAAWWKDAMSKDYVVAREDLPSFK